jgi:hypothetical protein
MRLPVSDRYITVTTLLHVPDHLFHYHQVAKVRVPAWHKSRQDMKRGMAAYRTGNLVIIPLTDYDAATDEIRDARKFRNYRGDRLDAKLRKQFLDIERRAA